MSKNHEKWEHAFIAEKRMNKNLNSEQVLAHLIEIIETSLSEVLGMEFKNEFVVGEWYAYVECLEVIARWKKAKKFGLDYNPEIKYNII